MPRRCSLGSKALSPLQRKEGALSQPPFLSWLQKGCGQHEFDLQTAVRDMK